MDSVLLSGITQCLLREALCYKDAIHDELSEIVAVIMFFF